MKKIISYGNSLSIDFLPLRTQKLYSNVYFIMGSSDNNCIKIK